jgi:DNA-binding NarL/FixJ family response regulator
VVVGDGDAARREALLAGLGEIGRVEVTGTAATGVDTIIEAWRHQPDVILLDLTLPGMDPAEVTRHLRRAAPDAAVCLVATSQGEAGISAALDAGARDCITHTASPEEIAIVLRRVATRGS